MPTYKFTAKFQLSTAISSPSAPIHRIGGWSESWYGVFASVQALLQTLQQGIISPVGPFAVPGTNLGWLGARSLLLPLGASIVGLRVQSVLPPGPAQSIAINYPGQILNEADIPQMALLCNSPALNGNNIKRFTLRGIPDTQVTEGEATLSQSFGQSLQLFFNSLNGLQFKGRDLSQPTFKMISIDISGNIQLETAYTGAVGDMVRLLKVRETVSGKLRGGRYQVLTVGPGTKLALLNWNFNAGTGGTVRKDATTYLNVDSANSVAGRIVTRRVGRPPIQFRGRRSRRP